jgi:hypothetical protein
MDKWTHATPLWRALKLRTGCQRRSIKTQQGEHGEDV